MLGGSHSACEINARFRSRASVPDSSTLNLGGRGGMNRNSHFGWTGVYFAPTGIRFYGRGERKGKRGGVEGGGGGTGGVNRRSEEEE